MSDIGITELSIINSVIQIYYTKNAPTPTPTPVPTPVPTPTPTSAPTSAPTPVNNLCSEHPTNNYCTSRDNDYLETEWQNAYFFSGGEDDTKYTDDTHFGGATPSNNPKANGADPSCGAKDWATLSTCIMGQPLRADGDDYPNDDDRSAKNYTYRSEKKWARDSVKKLLGDRSQIDVGGTHPQYNDICQNCEDVHGPGHRNCDGTVQFTNVDHGGKVPVLAHGIFSGPIGKAMCTTDKFPNLDIPKPEFYRLVNQFGAISRNCKNTTVTDDDGNRLLNTYNTSTPDALDNQCIGIITKEAFVYAGLAEDYAKLTPVNNGGVGIAWGHGLGNGGCGSSFFMKKGPHPTKNDSSTPDTATEHNVVLLFQTGTRAWSGEWNDSFGTQTNWTNAGGFDESMTGGKQAYIVQGADYEEDSASCVMPYMQEFSHAKLKVLLNKICSKLPDVTYTYDKRESDGTIILGETETASSCALDNRQGVCECDPTLGTLYDSCRNSAEKDIYNMDVDGITPTNINPNGDTSRKSECSLQDNTNPSNCKSFEGWGCGLWREGDYGQPDVSSYTACNSTKWMECYSTGTDSTCCNKYADGPTCDHPTRKWCTANEECQCMNPLSGGGMCCSYVCPIETTNHGQCTTVSTASTEEDCTNGGMVWFPPDTQVVNGCGTWN